MSIRQSIDNSRQAAESGLRTELTSLRPDLPRDSIEVVADEEGLLSAQIYGVEQASHHSGDALQKDTLDLFETAHRIYDQEETDALLRTLKVIAPKAGVAIAPASLALVELPRGVLVLTLNDHAVAASEDPLHLLAQALAGLKSIQAAHR